MLRKSENEGEIKVKNGIRNSSTILVGQESVVESSLEIIIHVGNVVVHTAYKYIIYTMMVDLGKYLIVH